MKYQKLLAAICLCLVFMLTSTAPKSYGELIFSDDFDSEITSDASLNYTAFHNWDVTAGFVDIQDALHLTSNGFPAPGNAEGHFVDMDGSNFAAGRIETKITFNLEPGVYLLEFDVAGHNRNETAGPNSMTVGLGNFYSEEIVRDSFDPFETVSRELIVTTAISGKLVFDHAGGDNQGLYLDNISIVSVPEPSSLVLLLIAGLSFRGRRNKAS